MAFAVLAWELPVKLKSHDGFRQASIPALSYPLQGDRIYTMTHSTHTTHSDVLNRLRRADGHLKAIITMIEDKRECVDVAQQLHAIGNAIENAKRIYIQDHIDNCLEEAAGTIPRGARSSLAEFKEITKYL
jgi:hypothetical protein NreA